MGSVTPFCSRFSFEGLNGRMGAVGHGWVAYLVCVSCGGGIAGGHFTAATLVLHFVHAAFVGALGISGVLGRAYVLFAACAAGAVGRVGAVIIIVAVTVFACVLRIGLVFHFDHPFCVLGFFPWL